MTLKTPPETFGAYADVVIVGAGAAGLIAALAAGEGGADVLLIERDPVPRGSTALSAGLIPAAGTRFQSEIGIADNPEAFAHDIAAKAHGEADEALVRLVAREAGPAIEWLAHRYGLPFSVVGDFDYPGHCARRMHGLPTRSGAELVDRLRAAVERTEALLITGATVVSLYVDDESVRGVEIARPDGGRESIGCGALVLACNGYGGDPELVARHIPAMRGALYFGHPGNRGDAVKWGEAMGAKLAHLSGYQGHGSVAHPHGILITWATIMEGGFQVDAEAKRFCDESRGYSEQAEDVIARPDAIAFTVFDDRIAAIARQFEDFRLAEAQGAILEAPTIEDLADKLKLSPATLAETFAEVERAKRGESPDAFGREFAGRPALTAPFKGVKVTGALFHTQGGAGRGRRGPRVVARRTGAQSLRGRRRGGRGIGLASQRLPLGQWPAHRDGAGPHRGRRGGEAAAGEARFVEADGAGRQSATFCRTFCKRNPSGQRPRLQESCAVAFA